MKLEEDALYFYRVEGECLIIRKVQNLRDAQFIAAKSGLAGIISPERISRWHPLFIFYESTMGQNFLRGTLEETLGPEDYDNFVRDTKKVKKHRKVKQPQQLTVEL
jgi:hypothetical protein